MLFLEARIEGQAVRWPLRQGRQFIGRSPDCDLVVNDRSMSARHIVLDISGRSADVQDLGSTNGTFLDGRRLPGFRVEPDTWFVAGRVLLVIREGLSLASHESSVGREDNIPAAASLSTTSSPEELALALISKGDGGEIPAELLAAVESDPGGEKHREGATTGLLKVLARVGEARGAFLAERAGNGWSIRAAWGEPPPAEIDAAWLDETEEKERPEVLVFPSGATGDGERRLVAFPWSGASGRDNFLVRLIGGILNCVVSFPVSEAGARKIPGGAVSVRGQPFLTETERCKSLLAEVDRVAQTPLPVLFIGESGTGKELLARRVHTASPRKDGPFVVINCSAVPETLLEAELFGIEKGVATGVNARTGQIAHASGGTLFLDEVGDLPLALQPKLLRALESGQLMPLGAPAPLPVDVRLVAATHRDLHAEAERGIFRRDFLFRVAGAVFKIPPLRARREDILPLARFFAEEAAGTQGRAFQGVDLGAARQLLGYSWPGNVRELRHAMARAVALADGAILHAGLLPSEIFQEGVSGEGDLILGLEGDWRAARERFDRLYFSRLLQRCHGNLTEAARLAGLARSNLYRRLEELGLR